MKLRANESLHCTDDKMVCDGNFSTVLPPEKAPKVRIMTSQRKNFDYESQETLCKQKLTLHWLRNGMWVRVRKIFWKFFRLFYPRRKLPKFELWRHSELRRHIKNDVIIHWDVRSVFAVTSSLKLWELLPRDKAAEKISVTYHFVTWLM